MALRRETWFLVYYNKYWWTRRPTEQAVLLGNDVFSQRRLTAGQSRQAYIIFYYSGDREFYYIDRYRAPEQREHRTYCP